MPGAITDSSSLIILLVVLVVAATVLKELFRPGRSRRDRFRSKPRGKKPAGSEGHGDQALASASEQLRRVMAADFNARALLNHSETQVFKALDAAGGRPEPCLAGHGAGISRRVSVLAQPRRLRGHQFEEG